jgi:hypothetical protein
LAQENNEPTMSTPRTALWRNGLTLVGGTLTILSLLFILSFLAIDLTSAQPSPYVGLFTYLVLPGVVFVAVGLVLLGLLLARRRYRRSHGDAERAQYYPRIDLNDARHRWVLGICGGAVVVTVPFVGVLSYEGYHYTDSNRFCGAVCHTVMEPQFTTYQQSPHAHVKCAECHIGAGASWYVKSKLSGIRQVFAVALGTFPRPIPPAIQELRPATETCRECHWPAKFFGNQLVTNNHFSSDENNTFRQLRMLLKTGGSDPSTGPPSGIHWHMALGYTIEYVAVDKHLQDIPWVETTDHTTGRRTVYRSDGLPATDPPPAGTRRAVDCMDCHNRPTHVFRSPDQAADILLYVNSALRTLPFAKREVVSALARSYPSKTEGLHAIPASVEEFYRTSYPAVWSQRGEDVRRLSRLARDVYETNFFPEMNVSWQTYPDNIGHKIFHGCFRCHEGRHVNETGRAISHECGTCHEFIRSGEGEANTSDLVRIGGFAHPIPLEGKHSELRCDQCHTGGPAPDATCAGCHSLQAGFRAGNAPAFQAFKIAPGSMADSVDCTGCHNLQKPTSIAAINEACLDCHSDDPARYGGLLEAWKSEADRLLGEAAATADDAGQKLVKMVRRAGPLHNIEATRIIARALSRGAPGTDAGSRSDLPAPPP